MKKVLRPISGGATELEHQFDSGEEGRTNSTAQAVVPLIIIIIYTIVLVT